MVGPQEAFVLGGFEMVPESQGPTWDSALSTRGAQRSWGVRDRAGDSRLALKTECHAGQLQKHRGGET